MKTSTRFEGVTGRSIFLAGLSLCALAAAPAGAQTAGEAAPVTPASTGVADIIVTAQKRAENLQSVPIAVSAVSGEMVENLQAVTLQGLQGAVPSIQIGSFGNTPNTAVFSIRGVGVIDPDPYAGSTVSIVSDGVPQYFSYGALLDLFDVERVEILRGPQGTLFGANTTGGVVNVVTRQPTGEFGGRAEITYGNRNRIDIKAAVDFPIIEDLLAGKVAAFHHGRDGWVTNIVDGSDMGSQDVTVVRGYLKLTPSPDFDATLIGEYARARNGAPMIVNGSIPGEALYLPPGPVAGAKLPMYASPCVPAGQRCHAPNKYYSASAGEPDISDMNTYRLTLTMNWANTAIGDLTSITGYKKFDLYETTDQDGTPLLFHANRRPTEGWQFNQELRTSVDLTDSIHLLVGGAYMKTHYDLSQNYVIEFALPGFRQFSTQDQDNWSGSLFAHSYIDLTDRLRLQAGVRYTHEKTEMEAGVFNFINLNGPAVYAGDTPLGGFVAQGSKNWDKFGWKLGLDFQATDNALLYGYYARGFKSGGFVGRITLPQDIGPFGPETVDTFEAGIKADWFGNRLRTNLTGFFTIYRDMQLAQIYYAPNEEGVLVNGNTIVNAAKSHIKGFELETVLVPVEGLTLNGSLAYLDAKYKNFDYTNIGLTGAPEIIDLSGYRLQNAPKWAGSASAAYEFRLGNGTTSANIMYNYTGKKYNTSLLNTPRATIQPTHYVNANVEWTPESERWSIGLWGRNLFDNRYIASVYDAPGIFALVNYAAPREYGVTLKYNW
ncbi:MAG: TonB-dependent receptor [Sphingomonadaceae bacterium]